MKPILPFMVLHAHDCQKNVAGSSWYVPDSEGAVLLSGVCPLRCTCVADGFRPLHDAGASGGVRARVHKTPGRLFQQHTKCDYTSNKGTVQIIFTRLQASGNVVGPAQGSPEHSNPGAAFFCNSET